VEVLLLAFTSEKDGGGIDEVLTNKTVMLPSSTIRPFEFEWKIKRRCNDTSTSDSGYLSKKSQSTFSQCITYGFEEERASLLVTMQPVDPRWTLRTFLAYSVAFSKPSITIPTVFNLSCEYAVCAPQLYLVMTQHQDRNNKVSIDAADNTYQRNIAATFTGSHRLNTESRVYVFQSERNAGPTIQAVLYKEEERYDAGDNIIDSFAISGIIVSSMLLLVTLAKLLLWLLLTPPVINNRQR